MPDAERTLYDALGVAPDAPHEVIKAAYRVLARLHHPDSAESKRSSGRMASINEAFEILSDSARRASVTVDLALRARTWPGGQNERHAASAEAREEAAEQRAAWAAQAAERDRRARAQAQAQAQADAAARAADFARR